METTRDRIPDCSRNGVLEHVGHGGVTHHVAIRIQGWRICAGIDEEEGPTGTPFADVYGNGNGLLMMTELIFSFIEGLSVHLPLAQGLVS